MKPILPLLLLAPVLHADPAPEARRVLVRGPRTVADAVQAALGPVLARREGARPVTVVVDVTPYTRDARHAILDALRDAETRWGGSIRSWRLARLGAAASPPVGRAGALAPFLPTVFRKPSGTTTTLPALRATLSRARERGGVVLYLADWHFEDDEGLEGLIGDLRAQGRTLTVIGSEAAFTRAWNDGFFPPDRDGDRLYDEEIGRDPFGPRARGVPWHGGATAFPHAPMRFPLTLWSTEFPADLPAPRTWDRPRDRYARPPKPGGGRRGARGTPEDLRERLGPGETDEQALERYWFPLPSSFGPYGLMRAAGATGGRYVLWSWNPDGRSTVDYEYARCDLFPPDLRPRRAILRDAVTRPLARALMRAWEAVSDDRVELVETTSPIDPRTGRTREMEEARARQRMPTSWHERSDHAEFLRAARDALESLDRAIAALDGALRAERGTDAGTRRWRADAELFRHVLARHRLGLGEGYASALRVGRDAWRDDGTVVGLHADDPYDGPELHHPDRLAAVEREGLELQARYRGTPWGELLERNPIRILRLDRRPVSRGDPGRRTPAVSNDDRDAPTTPGAGGSSGRGGGGPVSGGG